MSEQDIEKLVADHSVLQNENTALRSQVATLEEELALAQEQLAWLKKQIFGRKTDQSSVIMDGRTQLLLFPRLQAWAHPQLVHLLNQFIGLVVLLQQQLILCLRLHRQMQAKF